MLYTADSWLAADGSPSPRPALDREQLGVDALYRLYETQDGWLQLAAVREDALARPVPRPSARRWSWTTPASPTWAERAKHRSRADVELAEAFMADLATNWRRALRGRRSAG